MKRRPSCGHRNIQLNGAADLDVGGQLYSVEFVRLVTWEWDNNADCDADGRRGHAVEGISCDTFDETTIKVRAYDEEGEGVGPWQGFAELSGELQAAFLTALATYCEEHPPELEDEEEEPDGDRENDEREDRRWLRREEEW